MNKGNAVALTHEVDTMLKELVVVRNKKSITTTTKMNVVADMIYRAHKRECKKD